MCSVLALHWVDVLSGHSISVQLFKQNPCVIQRSPLDSNQMISSSHSNAIATKKLILIISFLLFLLLRLRILYSQELIIFYSYMWMFLFLTLRNRCAIQSDICHISLVTAYDQCILISTGLRDQELPQKGAPNFPHQKIQ